MSRTQLTMLAITVAALSGCKSRIIEVGPDLVPTEDVSYSEHIEPLFVSKCGDGACHINASMGGVNLSSHASSINSYSRLYRSNVILPFNADESPLMDAIGPSPKFGARMPRGSAPLSESQILAIRTWIDDGAADN